MKKAGIFLIVLTSAGILSGQTVKQKVAVWVSGSNKDITMVVADQLVNAISASNTYQAIERSADFLKMIQNEFEYQQSGNVDDRQIAELGKQFGVKLVCVARISPVAGTNYVSARIVNVETAAIVKSANINNKFETIEAIISSCESLASQLLGIKSRAEIDREQQAREQQRQEQEKEREEQERKVQEQEKFVKQERERGYTIIGNTLYVQTSRVADKVEYNLAVKACSTSRVGGYSDWRLPTKAEASRINAKNNEFKYALKLIDYSTTYHGHWTSTETKKNYRATTESQFELSEKWSETSCICVRGR